MVHLTRIYTRFGDDGECMLGDGTVVPKTSIRVGAYGAVDEANAALGMAVVECAAEGEEGAIRAVLLSVQQDLFDVGADLCTPIGADEQPGKRLRVSPEQTTRLEGVIDRFNADLKPLNSFVLPGGTRLAAALHLARATVRRAERDATALIAAEPAATNRHAVVYLNRVSDLLFVLSRVANASAGGDVLWVPGANRTDGPR
ncbi:MAG: cob(I)yrinic acid a,c-diamide adenosyltransferase [Phycisphaerales bacterium]|nr:cob(I)yrinic acid a,c-diamide adenosyltransferase [Phycisphaerales bacterium]